jgi:hypothetical protein
MRTVQIYVGRDVTDLDCIRVTFTIDGISQIVDVPMTGMENDKPKYEYNTDLSQGDYLATENGRRILTESNDVFITESSVFTPSITILWSSISNQWLINIQSNNLDFVYYSNADIYYPFINNWAYYGEPFLELEYLVTEQCRDLRYERLELFNDEKINLTLSVQNLSDISKTFTDFSQSFTVPGSVVNNKIFEHFYQNDVDGTLDYNIKRPAYIEIDFIPFRKGVVMLEKANLKNGLVDNYSISFFGQLTSLKDIFGETKINQLDLSSLAFTYTGANVLNRITDTTTDYDVRFPLIANDRLWTYADGGAEDITVANLSKAIQYTELFPAVKIARLFEAMEVYFGITFISQFFSDSKFTECFLLAKNATNMSFLTEAKLLDIVSYPSAAANIFDFVTDTVNVNYTTTLGGLSFDASSAVHNVNVYIGGIATDEYYIDVYINGSYYSTINGSGSNNYLIYKVANTPGLQNKIQIYVKGLQSFTFPSYITYIMTYLDNSNQPNSETYTATNSSTTVTGNINLNNVMPDIKIADFFSGILKQFNMTCVGIDQKTFQIEPLEDWYNQGSTFDVTPYIDIESTDVARVPLYKNINFKYQQSESFTNRNYFAISNSEYGNTNNVYNYDGGDFTIESPFENLLFNRSVGSSGQEAILGYFLNQNYQSYIPKPTLLYLYGSSDTLTTNIKFYNGTGYNNISSYALFGQDLEIDSVNYSLNFGEDNSTILNETIQNGLFATYYFSYLSNLYNLKQRLTTYKSMLPLSILTSLRLNDRLIIRDKRYIINDVKVELTTGEATLTLYNDFRQVDLGSLIIVEEPNSSVTFTVKYRSGSQSATMFGGFMTFDSETVTWGAGDYSDKTVTAYYESLPSPIERTIFVTYSDGSEIYVRIKQV